MEQPAPTRLGHTAPHHEDRNHDAPPTAAVDEPTPSGTWIYVVVLVLAAAIFGVGIFLAVQKGIWSMLAAGCVSVVAVLVAWPIASAMGASLSSHRRRQEEFASLMSERLQQIAVLLNVVSEQQLLSDRAKQVAFREKDRDALRRAIKEDLARRDWEGALVLVDDMEKTFGYSQEAAQFRQEINHHRQETVRRLVQEGVQQIDTYCRQEKWSEALREAERLMRLSPNQEQTSRLPQEIESRRQGTKRQLLDAFNEAVARKDVDGGIEIVKKLDMYLTRTEAEQLQESVRGIFKEKLNQLGVQFTLAARDEKWAEAIRTGELIVRDFPNSGIAREVRDMMPRLRERAGEHQPAGAATAEMARV